MPKIRSVHFSPDEYLAGTMGMTHQERGLYWQVCTLIYSSGAAIPEDDERLFAGPDNPRTTRSTLERLIKKAKITRTGADLMVNRCRTELESASNRMRIAIENGAKGGRPSDARQQNQGVTKPNPLSTLKLPTPTPTPTPTISKKDAPKAVNKSKRSPIPENWLPSEKDIAHAKNRQLDCETIKAVGEQFRDHHISKGTLFANHSAAWRTWIKNHIGYHGTGPWPRNGGEGAGGNGKKSTSVVDVIMRLKTEADREELGERVGIRVGDDGLRVLENNAGIPGDNGEVLEADETQRMFGTAGRVEIDNGE